MLLGILLIGIFFRLYNTPDRFGFDHDPTRDALISFYAAENLKFPLTGPFSGIANFTFGPWYYYEIILTRIIFNFDYSPFYLISIHSILFVFLMYILGKNTKDSKLGLIVAFLAAISPGQTGPSAGLSNPNLVPVHAAMACIMFVLLWKNRKLSWVNFIWGLVIGIGINHHYQMAPLLLLPFIFYIRNFKKAFSAVLLFIGGLFISFIPLIVFNLHNDFHTVRGVAKYLIEGSGQYVPNSWTIYLKEFWPAFWSYILGIPIWLGVLFAVLTVLVHLYEFYKHKLPDYYLYLGGVFAVIIFLLRYYSGARENYYVLFLHPFLFLFAGYPLWVLMRLRFGKLIVCIMLISIFLFSLPLNMQRLEGRKDHIIYQNDVNTIIDSKLNTSYSIYRCGDKIDSNIMGIMLLLHNKNKLSDSGNKLAIFSPNINCKFPEKAKLIISIIYSFENISEKVLNKNGWFKVNAEDVYNKYLNWQELEEKS